MDPIISLPEYPHTGQPIGTGNIQMRTTERKLQQSGYKPQKKIPIYFGVYGQLRYQNPVDRSLDGAVRVLLSKDTDLLSLLSSNEALVSHIRSHPRSWHPSIASSLRTWRVPGVCESQPKTHAAE